MSRQTLLTVAVWLMSLALAAVFIVSGAWKLYAPAQAGIRQVEAGVPSLYALPFAILLGSAEVFAAILLLMPAWRRWGGILTGVMLASFLAYMGARYSQLKGMECGCTPGRHRALGAGFFIEDGLMLAAAVAVVVLARPAAERARSFLRPLLIFLVVLGLGGASALLERTVLAGNASFSLHVKDREGRVAEMPLSPRSYTLLYFYNPTCLDCAKASREIAKLRLNAPLVVLPDSQVDTAYDYLKQAGIKNAIVSLDHAPLADKFKLGQVPALYLVRRGQPETVILNFEPAALEKTLRSYGVIS